MKEIPLNGGRFVVQIDDEDWDKVQGFGWYADTGTSSKTAYARANIKSEGRTVLMHRLIMGNPAGLVDHKDRNGLNNTRDNLRVTNRAGNAMNSAGSRNRKHSRFKGVTWDKDRSKWAARLGGVGFLGRFDKEADAAKAYNAAALKLHGEFAYLNPVHSDE